MLLRKPIVEIGRRWLSPGLMLLLICAVGALFLLPTQEAELIRAHKAGGVLGPPVAAKIPAGIDHRRLDTVSAPMESQSSIIRGKPGDESAPEHPESH
jgi:hypothetical protein